MCTRLVSVTKVVKQANVVNKNYRPHDSSLSAAGAGESIQISDVMNVIDQLLTRNTTVHVGIQDTELTLHVAQTF